jgi:hypothetical protein
MLGDFRLSLLRCSSKADRSGGVERARITFEIAPDRAHWGMEIIGKVKAWAKALTGPTSLPGKYPQLLCAASFIHLLVKQKNDNLTTLTKKGLIMRSALLSSNLLITG